MKVFLKNTPFIVLLMSAVAWIFPILAGAQEPKNIIPEKSTKNDFLNRETA